MKTIGDAVMIVAVDLTHGLDIAVSLIHHIEQETQLPGVRQIFAPYGAPSRRRGGRREGSRPPRVRCYVTTIVPFIPAARCPATLHQNR